MWFFFASLSAVRSWIEGLPPSVVEDPVLQVCPRLAVFSSPCEIETPVFKTLINSFWFGFLILSSKTEHRLDESPEMTKTVVMIVYS